MLDTIKESEKLRIHETESKIVDQLTERIAKMETESMQNITCTSASNRVENDLTKGMTY